MNKKAQAALELAVFGAILIFILGAIIRSAVGNSYNQNQNFKAMRMAMLASWQGSKTLNFKTGVDPRAPSPDISRNSASVLFVEDRLAPDFNKYGDLERNPFIAQGAGTFSYSLFYSMDKAEVGANVPIMDVYINGLHFPFTTASYVTNKTITASTPCSSDCRASTPPQQQCLRNQASRNQREWVADPLDSTKTYKLFYTRVPNGTKGTPAFNSNADNPMFDLQRLGVYDSSNPSFVPASLRSDIAWQWFTVPATTAKSIKLDASSNQFPTYDIDGRLKEVTIYAFSPNPNGSPMVSYEDPNGGDIDSSWDLDSCGPKPGLQNDSQIYTFTANGTYLQIKEGKMYNPETGRFVRSAGRRNTIDLIQRTIQLSNNTYRFCSKDGHICNGSDGVACANPNPVEVCIPPGSSDNCSSTQQNIKSVCYDENDNVIFVRSRLKDRSGNLWMTDASGQLKVQ